MKIVKHTLRAVVERVTEIEYEDMRLFVFEDLDEKGCPHNVRIQNWENFDITRKLTRGEREEIANALYEHHRSKANSSD